MLSVNERIAHLREWMSTKGIDIFYIPNADDHLSEEYVAPHYRTMSYMSGFRGDAGCLIVTQDFAGLWTDGRYFTQAEKELQDTCVTLMRMRQEGVPEPLDFLMEHTPDKGLIGYDGKLVSMETSLRISRLTRLRGVKIHVTDDPAGEIWGEDRPALPKEPLFVLDEKYTGESVQERLVRVREEMVKNGADVLVLSALEDPCWVFNVRGNDIPCLPVAYAYAVITLDEAAYYVDEEKVTPEVQQHFEQAGVEIKPYEELQEDLSDFQGRQIWIDYDTINTRIGMHLGGKNRYIRQKSPVGLMRAVKNETEIRNTINAHLKDGTAMVKFIHWLKETVGTVPLTEVDAQNKLYELREAEEDYIEPSFPTISAYKGNAAMLHYSATEEKHAAIQPEGFLLVDSGGTYRDGTTDITRTISLGPLSEAEKRYYTLTLKGHLALGSAVFLYGTTGYNLDILARGPVWKDEIDYQCGTGHGVGHVLSVHEGPQGIRWGVPTAARPNAVLEPGMIVTNEPGVYLPDELGVRIENELLVVKAGKNFYGQFLRFEDLTYCPYEIDALDLSLLSKEEIEQINAYHERIYSALAPRLDEEEREWLAHAVRRIEA